MAAGAQGGRTGGAGALGPGAGGPGGGRGAATAPLEEARGGETGRRAGAGGGAAEPGQAAQGFRPETGTCAGGVAGAAEPEAPAGAEARAGAGGGAGAGGSGGPRPAGAGGPGGAGAGEDPLGEARDQFRHVSLFWTDLIHLMASKPQALTSAGPMRNYAESAKRIATEMLAAGQDAAEFSEALSKYYDQLAATWAGAQRKVDAKLPRIPNDLERFEAYKRVWIDMFDNDFTELFDSKRFGDNYGRLVSKELDLARHWNNVMDVVLRSANLPSKKDVEGVYRELHGLKRRVSKLEAENRRLRAAAGEARAAPGVGAEGGGAGGA